MGWRGEKEGKFGDLTSLKPFSLRDGISDLISFTSDLWTNHYTGIWGGKELGREAVLDLAFVLESLTFGVADSNKHFLNAQKNERRLSSPKNVADESWLFLYIHSDECLSEKKKKKQQQPETKTKQIKVTS